MELQSVCLGSHVPNFKLPDHRHFLFQYNLKAPATHVGLSNGNYGLRHVSKWCLMPEGKMFDKEFILWRLSKGRIVCASGSDPNSNLKPNGKGKSGEALSRYGGVEPFRGKSGSVSFHGLTHRLVEESKLTSAPFEEEKGSFLWVLAPVALISSLIAPQFFFSNAIEAFFKDETLIELVSSFSFEVMFYVGLGMFLLVTDHVQRPYLQFSAKRWGLITGLRGYLTSSLLSTSFKIIAPLIAVYVTWPVLGFPMLVAVAPFLAGCAVQLAFETILEKRQSSCWPLVPIIFEVYRLYQLTRATQFIQHFLLLMKDSPRTPEMFERGGALIGMIGTFQALGVVCLWSLMTFLLRLFPSRPVSENY